MDPELDDDASVATVSAKWATGCAGDRDWNWDWEHLQDSDNSPADCS